MWGEVASNPRKRYNGGMPIEPIKIPQNVQIEDRIIGPITLRQLIITVVGCGVSYVLWSGMEKAFGTASITVTIIAWIPALIFVAFAFVKIYDVSLLRFMRLMIGRWHTPQKRLWIPRAVTPTLIPHVCVDTEKKTSSTTTPTVVPSLEALSSVLDARSTGTPPPPASPSPSVP